MRTIFATLLIPLTFSCLAFSASIPTHGTLRLAAHRRVTTGTANATSTSKSLAKRVDNARLTYYKAGQGACGGTNNDGDWIVALNSKQFDNGSHCYKSITISYGGKTAQAQVVDECPGCPYGGLDLTSGLFSYFASTDQGVIYGHWDLS